MVPTGDGPPPSPAIPPVFQEVLVEDGKKPFFLQANSSNEKRGRSFQVIGVGQFPCAILSLRRSRTLFPPAPILPRPFSLLRRPSRPWQDHSYTAPFYRLVPFPFPFFFCQTRATFPFRPESQIAN